MSQKAIPMEILSAFLRSSTDIDDSLAFAVVLEKSSPSTPKRSVRRKRSYT